MWTMNSGNLTRGKNTDVKPLPIKCILMEITKVQGKAVVFTANTPSHHLECWGFVIWSSVKGRTCKECKYSGQNDWCWLWNIKPAQFAT